ncbi:MAG: hypothetical protein L0I93_01285 [Atopostipes suicloacalis]|nr:hypothetical protein [Atopostipes suicloacalis]
MRIKIKNPRLELPEIPKESDGYTEWAPQMPEHQVKDWARYILKDWIELEVEIVEEDEINE